MISLSASTESPASADESFVPQPERTDLAVKAHDVCVTYRTTFEKRPTLKQAIIRAGRGQRATKTIEALKHVSFEVKVGTTVGVIGSNGAGKSTLLRTLSGILPPTSGHVESWGKASTLLALGVGFNNGLSGRENIVLGALANGWSPEQVDERVDEICAWTEIGDFIDAPMRTYSSGMVARVGFAVGAHMDPDILMVDEALSTGDAKFREKATKKMDEMRSKSRAMFFVSHGMGTVKELCDDCLWMHQGELVMRGKPDDVVKEYLDFTKVKKTEAGTEEF